MRVEVTGLAACLSLALSAAGQATEVGKRSPLGAQAANVPAVGKFLVASRELRDPNFRETVVLIIDHDRRSGALGLVINRPSAVELFRIIPHVDGVERLEDRVFRGGPVDPTAIMVLLRSSETPAEASTPVFDDVYRSASQSLLERLAVARRPDESFRAYAGYAGWAPGQLEAEIAAGGWHVVSDSAAAIFDEDPSAVWSRLQRVGSAEWASMCCGRSAPESGARRAVARLATPLGHVIDSAASAFQ